MLPDPRSFVGAAHESMAAPAQKDPPLPAPTHGRRSRVRQFVLAVSKTTMGR